MPGARLSGYELPTSADGRRRGSSCARDGEAIRVYVHPETLPVLHTVTEDERFMRLLFRLHGELLMGDRGSMLVELAASWTIIMIVTGLVSVVAAAGQGPGRRRLSAAGGRLAHFLARPAQRHRRLDFGAGAVSACSADCRGPSRGATTSRPCAG